MILTTTLRYHGVFSVLNHTKNANNTFNVKLDTIHYNDIDNNVKLSRELVVGDKLALLNHNTLFEVVDINFSDNSAVLKRIYGYDELITGVANLVYVDTNVKRHVNMQLRYNEFGLAFIASTHNIHGTMSNYSNAYPFSTKAMLMNVNGEDITVNEYIRNNNGTDVSEYISSIINQSSIALKYAVKPSKPAIDASMFKVVQINKHIVEGSDVEYIKKLYAAQKKLSDELKAENENVANYKTVLESANYKNEYERKQVQQQLQNANANIDSLNSQYSNVISELSNKDIGLYASTYSPKYRVRGFWPIEDDLVSEFTRPQKIIGYRLQYRYVSANDKIAQSDNYSLKQQVGNETVELTGAFSSWVEVTSPILRQVTDAYGNITYSDNNIADAEQININQLDLAITSNEQIDVRIKAITEVGYPTIAVESDWSDIVRITYPPELASDIDFAKLEELVKNEKQKIELHSIIGASGITRHIQNSITEQHAYFAHSANEIDSGFFTAEMNRIPLNVQLSNMQKDIDTLRNTIINNTNTLKLSVIDAFDNEYIITNNASIKVFAGFYTDLATTSAKGDIVSHQLYIKVTNTSPSQIYSLMPGDIDADIVSDIYSDAPVGYIQSASRELPFGKKQTYGQIAYLRNRNVINNFDLYETNQYETMPHTLTVPTESIDAAAPLAEKNAVHVNASNSAETIKIKNEGSTNFIAVSTAHPQYVANSANAEIKAYLQLLATRLPALQTQKQAKVSDNIAKMMFIENDKFLIGDKTTGAFLIFNPIDESQLHVNSNAVESFKEVKPDTAVLIPILFQYRMTDALGRLNGDYNNSNTDLTYTKRIGVDMLINGQTVKFDIEVSAKYTPNSLSSSKIPQYSAMADKNNRSTLH
jgi:hypothetical protein